MPLYHRIDTTIAFNLLDDAERRELGISRAALNKKNGVETHAFAIFNKLFDLDNKVFGKFSSHFSFANQVIKKGDRRLSFRDPRSNSRFFFFHYRC